MRSRDVLLRERNGVRRAIAAAGGGRGGFGRGAQTVRGEIRGVGKSRGVAADDPDAGAPLTPRDHLLDLAVVEPSVRRPAIFGEDLGEISTVLQGVMQRRFENILVEHPYLAVVESARSVSDCLS